MIAAEEDLNMTDNDLDVNIVQEKWKGEDEEDEVKDNWDDEDEPEETVTEEKPRAPVVSKKSKLNAKIAEKERLERESKRKPRTAEEELADKLERQRLQEEADLLLAKEAFGEESNVSKSGSGLDISLHTKEDFDSFRKSLVDKLVVYDKSPHFVNFLESLFREVCVSVESDDIKRLSSSLTALFNEKVKAQKAGTKPKRKGKGVSVKVERNHDLDFDSRGNDLEDFDDFM